MKRIFTSLLLGVLMFFLVASPCVFLPLRSNSAFAITSDVAPEIEFFNSKINKNGDMWNVAFFGGGNFVLNSKTFSTLIDDDSVSGFFTFLLSSSQSFFDIVSVFIHEDILVLGTEGQIDLTALGNLFPSSGLLVIYNLDFNRALSKVEQFSDTTDWRIVFVNSFSVRDPNSPFYGINTLALFSTALSVNQGHNTFINSLKPFSGLSDIFRSISPWIQSNATQRGYIFGKFPIPESFVDYKSTSNESISMQFSLCTWHDVSQFSGNSPIEVTLANLYHVTKDFSLDSVSAAFSSYILLQFPNETVIDASMKALTGNSVVLDLNVFSLAIYEDDILKDMKTGLRITASTYLFTVQGPFPPNIIVKRVLSTQFPVKGEIVRITIIIENPSDFDITEVLIDDSANLQVYLYGNLWKQNPCKIVEGKQRAVFDRISAESSRTMTYKVRFDEVGVYKMSDIFYEYFVDDLDYVSRFEETAQTESAFIYVQASLIDLTVTYWPIVTILGFITALIAVKHVWAFVKNRRS
ncbi:MAG: hypothetical protein ACFFC7_32385 [Candidatus Hermodarchaeota archaeon]